MISFRLPLSLFSIDFYLVLLPLTAAPDGVQLYPVGFAPLNTCTRKLADREVPKGDTIVQGLVDEVAS